MIGDGINHRSSARDRIHHWRMVVGTRDRGRGSPLGESIRFINSLINIPIDTADRRSNGNAQLSAEFSHSR